MCLDVSQSFKWFRLVKNYVGIRTILDYVYRLPITMWKIASWFNLESRSLWNYSGGIPEIFTERIYTENTSEIFRLFFY